MTGAAVGVDGCLGGWVTVEWSAAGLQAARVEDLAPLIERLRTGDVAAVAIDMPIGLLDHQPRAADVEARKLLGPRRSSIFPTPVRVTLDAESYDEACRLSRQTSGKALSKQAFNLLPKIAELDKLVTPDDQDRLVEAHPECAFVRLAEAPLLHAKRTDEGKAQRIDLLTAHHPDLGELIRNNSNNNSKTNADSTTSERLPMLDLIDAAVLAVTARRVIEGSEVRLGTEVDRTGLRAQIVY